MKPIKRKLNGILLIDKPIGLSSNAVLQKIKYLYQAKKAGHTGSLDPLATGMLPICFGEATKFSQYLLEADKTYEVTAQLGSISSTGDAEGELTQHADINKLEQLSISQIEASLEKFIGLIKQIPPMYSALKHKGQPLYKYARQGEVIERKAREITIYSNQILSNLTQLAQNNWQIKFRVSCSKGTYIRTLIEDIGLDLSCGAYVTELRRTGVAPYDNCEMINFDGLFPSGEEVADLDKLDKLLLPMDTAINHWPQIVLNSDEIIKLQHGQALFCDVNKINKNKINLTRFHDQENNFLGVGELDLSSGEVIKRRLLATN